MAAVAATVAAAAGTAAETRLRAALSASGTYSQLAPPGCETALLRPRTTRNIERTANPLRPPPRPRVTIDVMPPVRRRRAAARRFVCGRARRARRARGRRARATRTPREAARQPLARRAAEMTRQRAAHPLARVEKHVPRGFAGRVRGKTKENTARAAVFTRFRGPRPEEQEFRRRGGRAARDVARARGTRGRLDAARRFVRHDQSRDALDRGVHVEFLRARRVVIDRGIETTPNERGDEETRRRGVVHFRVILAPSVRFVRSRGILAPSVRFVLARSVERDDRAQRSVLRASRPARSRVPGRASRRRVRRAHGGRDRKRLRVHGV